MNIRGHTTAPYLSKDNSVGPKTDISIFGQSLSLIDVFLIIAMSALLLLQLQLQFVQKMNWDEFFYLSHIYEAQEGRLDKTLQMAHVYVFGWLTKIPGGEMMQITVGRCVMWAAQLGTLFFIIKTARHFTSLTSALFAALSFLGLGFVFIHGTSFRADPLAAMCMMLVIYIFTVSKLRLKDLAVLSIALALGAFVTIKVILFAPLFAALVFWRSTKEENKVALFIKFSLTILSSGVLFLIALLLHKSTLSDAMPPTSSSSLSSTAHTMFLSGGLFPRRAIMEIGFYTGFVPTLMVGLGALLAVISVLKHKTNRQTNLIILAFALPLLTFVFYRNAYPYFYAFICPSAFILIGYAVYKLKLPNLIIVTLTVLMMLSTTAIYKTRLDETRDVQSQTLTVVHEIFPEPVSYFDRNGMVASFPKAGGFMSSWGLRNYLLEGERQFLKAMHVETIPLVIDNNPEISAALRGQSTRLFDEDAAALKDNYIHHWGHIWVAGKTLNVSDENTNFLVLVPGKYTVEGQANIWLDGQLFHPNDTVMFERGLHTSRSEVEQNIVLKWGSNLLRPDYEHNPQPIFGGF